MKENEGTSMNTFNPGEYCRFKSEEIPHILDILRANGHKVMESHAFEKYDDAIIMNDNGDLHGISVRDYQFNECTELSRHDFMVIALRLEDGMGICYEDSTSKQRRHIYDEMRYLGLNVYGDRTGSGFDSVNSYYFDGSHWLSTDEDNNYIPYHDWCQRLCVEPIVETKTGLPENGWAILCTEESMAHPMWKTMIGSLNFTIGTHEFLFGDKRNVFYGMDDSGFGSCGIDVLCFGIGATLITIDDWCRMTGNVTDLTDESDLPDWTTDSHELMTGRSEPVTNEPAFDPLKPFQVRHTDSDWYNKGKHYYYVGKDRDGRHVIQDNVGVFEAWRQIRNIQQCTADMLEVGEWMEVTQAGPYEGWIIQKMQNTYLYCPEYAAVIVDSNLKGRKVQVEVIVKEG